MAAILLRASGKKGLRFLVAATLAVTLLLKILQYYSTLGQGTGTVEPHSQWTDQLRTFDLTGRPVPSFIPLVQSQDSQQDMLESTKTSSKTAATSTATVPTAEAQLDCSHADGLQDIVYVIKTGATEAMEKLPIHFNTTMRCFPNVLIFSDHAETIDGHLIHDALDSIIEDIRFGNADFELWRRLHQDGRGGLKPEEMSDRLVIQDPNDAAGQGDNGGWRLDRFKNIPIVSKTIALSKPEAKWFIFTDADTFVSWANLLQYTSLFDHEKPWYIGSPAQFGDLLFNHGGSGYILSRPAMNQLAELYDRNQEQWDRYADSQSYGDVVLGTALKNDLNMSCTWAFPQMQGGDASLMEFSLDMYDRRLWCYGAISYHHLTPATIQSLWQFEQRFHNMSSAKDGPMRHMHVFEQWAMPQMSTVKHDWDNDAEIEVEVVYDETLSRRVMDLASCEAHCEGSDCFQWSFLDGVCRISTAFPKLGNKRTPGATSGWRIDAIEAWAKELDGKCDGQWDWYIE